MVMVDQRNHGASSDVKGFHPPHSIQASAGDLLQLVQTKLSGRTPDLLVGHSLGGKTVLELLRQLQDSGQHVPKQVSHPLHTHLHVTKAQALLICTIADPD